MARTQAARRASLSYYHRNKDAICLQRRSDVNKINRWQTHKRNNAVWLAAYSMVKSAKERAEAKGRAFDSEWLTAELVEFWLERDSTCRCCLAEFSFEPRDKGGPHKASPTLDRYCNSLGYVEGNVFLICSPCNRMKSDGDVSRMQKLLQYMTKKPETHPSFDVSLLSDEEI